MHAFPFLGDLPGRLLSIVATVQRPGQRSRRVIHEPKLHNSLTWVDDNLSIRVLKATLWLRKLLCTCREASGLSDLLVSSPCVHLHLHLLDPVSR